MTSTSKAATSQASEIAGASHGTLTLNSDGSFTYVPTSDYIGPDSFTYVAEQGDLYSNVATVTITVYPTTYYVSNVADSGPGSLRQAILDVNAAGQRLARHDPLRHPRHRPIHHRAAFTPAGGHATGGHRRLFAARCKPQHPEPGR